MNNNDDERDKVADALAGMTGDAPAQPAPPARPAQEPGAPRPPKAKAEQHPAAPAKTQATPTRAPTNAAAPSAAPVAKAHDPERAPAPPVPAPAPPASGSLPAPPVSTRPIRPARPGVTTERPLMPPPTAGWSDRGSTRAPSPQSASSSSSSSSSAAAVAAAAAAAADPFARIVEGESVGVALPAGAIHPGTGASSWSASSSVPRGAANSSSSGALNGSMYKSLAFRRTIIPIMLTLGVSLPGLAGWWWTLDEDAPLKHTGTIVPITLLVVGVVLLLLAIVNMLHVRAQLLARQMSTTA